MSRYARQMCLPQIGSAGQARLAKSRVAVVGAGGLGATVLPQIVGAGVGFIRILDPDIVEESNLHRQTLYRMADLGRPKVEVAAETLTGLNPDCTLEPHRGRLDPASVHGWLTDVDLVVDAADSFATSYALSDFCRQGGVPLISASAQAQQGYVGGFCGGAPSLRAVFPDLPAVMGNCADTGVMGPVVASVAGLQAQMTLAVLLNLMPSPLGQLLSLDLSKWHVSGFRFDGAPEPDRAVPDILSSTQIIAQDLVVDLRSAAPPVPKPAPDQRVVFICNSGLRAWRAAKALEAQGHARVAIIGMGE
ncbi:thiamine biosynthesis protein ThiF [Litorivita pollutaquae]|uniref:Thiamine biosynthesis protein ThiF n=1 Tax=Litorivita pollutaquae TaxID=2200892 RepID=A0A2V4MKY7_9RHOB|nr:HesA/MoeB/ThiF family protein [Litorivita pollutaquae]PYC47315.1 thiamine biosynthesis protein ThiF [Litorivita pollutaquae]